MDDRVYVISPKPSATAPPQDWKERLAAMEGVILVGSTRNQAQFRATADAVRKVGNELGSNFTIEQTVEREPFFEK